MRRRVRKNKHTAKVGWVEIRNSLRWTLRLVWWFLSLSRYLNPLRHFRHRPATYRTPSEGGTIVFRSSLWERFVDAFRSEDTKKQKLLDWCQEQLPTFRVTDYSATWCDGVAFCALLESVCPGSCPRYDLLKAVNKTNNCRLGLKLAYRYLSIPQSLITAEEIADGSCPDKLRLLLKHVHWAAAQHNHVSNIDWSRTSRPVRAGSGGLLKEMEPCVAKGGGLVNGVVGKRCKFNLFVLDSSNLNLEIDIRGPHGEQSHERIKRETPNLPLLQKTSTRGGSRSSFPSNHHKNDPSNKDITRAKSLWQSFAGKNLFSHQRNTTSGRSGVVKCTPVVTSLDSRETNVKRKRIPFNYQCLGEHHLLISYVPCSAGSHSISIRWHGEPIPGSPFTVKVALSVDTIVRARHYLKDTVVKDNISHTASSPGGSDAQTGSGKSSEQSSDGITDGSTETPPPGAPHQAPHGSREEDEDAPVQAAILSRTSTIHRSLGTRSPTLAANPRLTKQATITRKRVLRRVMAKSGQEIVIHESQSSSSTEQLQDNSTNTNQTVISKERRGSPSPKRKSFDFETAPFADSTPSEGNIKRNSDGMGVNITGTVGKKEEKHKNSNNKRPTGAATEENSAAVISRIEYRRYNSDSLLNLPNMTDGKPSSRVSSGTEDGLFRNSSTEKSLLEVPMHDDNFKSSPFLPGSVWASDLAAADINEKLLEGGFITHMPSSTSLMNKHHDRMESDSTLDSDSDGVGFRSLDKSTSSEKIKSITSATSSDTNAPHLSESSVDSIEIEITNVKHKNSLQKFDGFMPDTKDNVNTEQDKMKVPEKKKLGKTWSDPMTRAQLAQLKNTPPQRSNTSPGRSLGRQASVDYSSLRDMENATIKLLQSDSLKKSCFYVTGNQWGKLEHNGSSVDTSSLSHDSSEGAEMDFSYGGCPGGIQRDLQDIREDEDLNMLKTQNGAKVRLAGENMKQKTHRFKHPSQHRSLSLPAMSKKWQAFELDSDEEIDNGQKIMQYTPSKRKPKRASLGSVDLRSDVQAFQRIFTVTHDGSPKDHDRLTPLDEEQTPPFVKGSRLPEIAADDIPPNSQLGESEEMKTLTTHHQASSRPFLPRQVVCQNSSSPDINNSNESKSQDNAGSDKENDVPNDRQAKFTQDLSNPVRLFSQNMDSLKPSFATKNRNKLNLKMPKAKVDRTTQVSYNEIKEETGWVNPSVRKQKRKKYVRRPELKTENNPIAKTSVLPEGNMQLVIDITELNEYRKGTDALLDEKDTGGSNKSTNHESTSAFTKIAENISSTPTYQSINSTLTPKTLTPTTDAADNDSPTAANKDNDVPVAELATAGNSVTVGNHSSVVDNAMDLRTQSTGNTFVKESPDPSAKLSAGVPIFRVTPTSSAPISYKAPRLISGHRVVTRLHKNRKRVVPDLRLFRSSSSHDDEQAKTHQTDVRRAAGMIKVVNHFTTRSRQHQLPTESCIDPTSGLPQSSSSRRYYRSKIGSQRRRVMFSRRVMLHRRSSSRGSCSSKGSTRNSTDNSFSKDRSFQSGRFLTVQASSSYHSPPYRSNSDSAEEDPLKRPSSPFSPKTDSLMKQEQSKRDDKRENVERWLSQTANANPTTSASFAGNNSAQSLSGSDDVMISLSNSEDSENQFKVSAFPMKSNASRSNAGEFSAREEKDTSNIAARIFGVSNFQLNNEAPSKKDNDKSSGDDTVSGNIDFTPMITSSTAPATKSIDNFDQSPRSLSGIQQTDSGGSCEHGELCPPEPDVSRQSPVGSSSDDPSYRGFGVSPDVRHGLLEELNAFSNLTSPEYPCSRRTSLKSAVVGGNLAGGEMIGWEANIQPAVVEEVLLDEGIELPVNTIDPVAIDDDNYGAEQYSVSSSDGLHNQQDRLSEIRELLELALSDQSLSPAQTPSLTFPPGVQIQSDRMAPFALSKRTESNVRVLGGTKEEPYNGTHPEGKNATISDLPENYQAARPERCSAFGTGLTEGLVAAKNNFQVETVNAGNGTLTVGITGPRPHTVMETNVTYTGDDLYDVIYDVTQPGYYVITVKWSDISIPGSPFVCKISYPP